jgi:hypothetical protein
MRPRLELRQRAGLGLTPGMQTSLTLLRLPRADLIELIDRELARNPFLRRAAPGKVGVGGGDTPTDQLIARSVSFQQSLCQQLSRMGLDRRTESLAVLLVGFGAIFLIGGDRGPVAQIAVGFALAFAATVRPIRHWEFALLTLAGFVIFSLIGIWRSGADISEAAALQEYGYWQVSANLAQSFVPLTQSILIADAEGFSFGLLWLSQIVGVVPFAQQILFLMTDLSLADVSSSTLITTTTLGENAGSGIGTSFVADIYLNFGVAGLIVLSALYGTVCARMNDWLKGGEGFNRYLVAIVFASLVLYVARSSALFQLKPVLWSLGFCWLLLTVKVRRADPAIH